MVQMLLFLDKKAQATVHSSNWEVAVCYRVCDCSCFVVCAAKTLKILTVHAITSALLWWASLCESCNKCPHLYLYYLLFIWCAVLIRSMVDYSRWWWWWWWWWWWHWCLWCRLDTRLYKFCHRDATSYCHAPQHWYSQRNTAEESAPAMGYLVLACLYRSITRVGVVEAAANIQQDMHQVTLY